MGEDDLERRCQPVGNFWEDVRDVAKEMIIPFYSTHIVVQAFRGNSPLTRREAIYGCFVLESCKIGGYLGIAYVLYNTMT